jgi:hypothetical protein
MFKKTGIEFASKQPTKQTHNIIYIKAEKWGELLFSFIIPQHKSIKPNKTNREKQE